MGEPESPTRENAADYGAYEMDIVEHDKPTQSDCMSIENSPYTTEEHEERAGATPSQPEKTTNGTTNLLEATQNPRKRTSFAGLYRWITGGAASDTTNLPDKGRNKGPTNGHWRVLRNVLDIRQLQVWTSNGLGCRQEHPTAKGTSQPGAPRAATGAVGNEPTF